MGVLNILIAVVIAVVIWRSAMWALRMLATPPPEVDPEEVEVVHQGYRCSVCGTEVTMTVRNVREGGAPRHCREEMVPV